MPPFWPSREGPITRVTPMGPGDSAALATRLTGRPLAGEREIPVDQTNRSVIVADLVVVKWLLPPVPEPHPGVEVLIHLAERGFTDMPAFVGTAERDGVVEAILTEYLPGAQDGWDWFVDDVDAWLRGDLPFGALTGSAAQMGALTARLHTALADLQPSSVAVRTYHAQAMEALDHCRREVAGPEGARLTALAPEVERALAPLDTAEVLPAHRIHGDLHAGQFLRTDDRLAVTDFDGNPLADEADRRLPQTPLRDLASLLQSLDHVGRIVVRRRHPDRAADVDRFIAAATAAALGEYGTVHPVHADVLHALRVAQELHEFRYAVSHLPRWLYVPDAALPALLA